MVEPEHAPRDRGQGRAFTVTVTHTALGVSARAQQARKEKAQIGKEEIIVSIFR